jgi:hypothetical protein
VQGLIRLLGNYYDSESKDRLLTTLTKVDEILGELIVELNDDQSKDKSITYLFSLYATCVCLYCIIQLEWIRKFSSSRNETEAIINRIKQQMKEYQIRYDDVQDKLHKSIEKKFSDIYEKKHIPFYNWINPIRSCLWYKFEYNRSGKVVEAKKVRCDYYNFIQHMKELKNKNKFIVKKVPNGGCFIWPENLDKNNILQEVEGIRENDIEETFQKEYTQFLNNKSSFLFMLLLDGVIISLMSSFGVPL